LPAPERGAGAAVDARGDRVPGLSATGAAVAVTSLFTRRQTNNQHEENVMSTHEGSCFCGAVQVALDGAPAAMGYCHCESCRHWSAGPINAFTLWKPEAVKITKGVENLSTYN